MSAMDSVLTLVNPSPPTELVFNRDSTLDARVYIDARPAYLIATTETPGRFGSRTDIQDLRTEQVVVSIEENPVTPNRIRVFGVNGATTLKVKDWLKKREVEHKHPEHIIETEYGSFTWKIHPVYRLALSRDGDEEQPLAYMRVATDSSPLALVVESELVGFTDLIIASWMVLERKLRMSEKKARKASGTTTGGRLSGIVSIAQGAQGYHM